MGVQPYNSLEYNKPNDPDKQIIESLARKFLLSEKADGTLISTTAHSGSTARRIAKFRPKVPIFAFTESQKVRVIESSLGRSLHPTA